MRGMVAPIGAGLVAVLSAWGTGAPAEAAPQVAPVFHAARVPAPTAPQAPGTLHASATSGWTARNWAGYAVTGSGYTRVSGTWRVPAVTKTKKLTYSASWVGVDGFNDSNLIQAGTGQDWSAGAPHSYAWWEILPAPETTIPTTAITVHPGDLMKVVITKGSPTWTITISDQTTAQSFTTHQPYTGPGMSAEWIEEAPMIGRRLAPLAKFSLTTFNDAAVNDVNANLTSADRGVMIRGKNHLATPSLPSTDRDGFALQRGKLTPVAPPP